jgi:hypothetical protein
MRFIPVIFFLLSPVPGAGANSPFRDLFFEPNVGQADAGIRFVARTPGANLGFSSAGLHLQLPGDKTPTVLIRLPGANKNARFEPLDPEPSGTSYFIGSDPAQWHRDVPHFRRLAWRSVYPGIDLIFYGQNDRLEYDFVVAPGADPSLIRLSASRPARLSLTDAGDISVRSGQSVFAMKKPVVYQKSAAGADSPVPGRYTLAANGEVRFALGPWDRSRPLIVDPVVTFSSYFGGEKDDSVVAVTALNDVVGTTSSFAFGTGPRRGKDIFFSVAGYTGVVIFGGSDDDVATSAVSDQSNLTIGGWTRSKDLGTRALGGTDGFIATISRRSNFFFPDVVIVGGSGDDRVNSVSTQSYNSGIIYFAGETNSPDLTRYGNPLSTQLAGGVDAFFGHGFSSGGIISLAYYGGTGDDRALAITANSSGQMIIAGKTTSTDLPLKDPLSAQLSGPSDAFIARFTNFGTILEFGTYFGGSGDDEIRAVTVQSITYKKDSPLFFAGVTSSPDLPLVKPSQAAYGGGDSDAFAGSLDLDSRTLVFSTYIGGADTDEANAIALGPIALRDVDGLASLVIAGSTKSANLPVVNSFQRALAGPQDAMYAVLSPRGALQSLSYFGGSGSDRALHAIVSADNILTLSGETDSPDLPSPARNEAPSVPTGAIDGFIAGIPLDIGVIRFTQADYWTAKDFLGQGTVFVSSEIPNTARLTLKSSDPAIALLSLDSPGKFAPQVSVPLAALSRGQGITFSFAGVADTGEAEISVEIEGYGSQKARIRLAPPLLRLSVSTSILRGKVYLGERPSIGSYPGLLDDNGGFVFLARRADAPHLVVNYAVSNPAAGTVSPSQSLLGDNSYLPAFTPLAPGEEVITASSSIPVEPASFAFSVVQPTVGLADFAAGNNLDRAVNFTFDGPSGSYTDSATVTSSDSDRLCVLPESPALSACSATALVRPFGNFYVRALSDAGSVQLSYSTPSFGSGGATVRLSTPTITISPPGPVQQGQTASGFLVYNTNPPDNRFNSSLRPGFDPGIVLTSSDTSVFTVKPDSRFNPLVTGVSPGQATLTISAPGFNSANSVTVTVVAAQQPAISVGLRNSRLGSEVAVGKDLVGSITVSAVTQSPIRLTSSDPSLLLLASNASAAPAAQVSVSSSSTVSLHALAGSGTATVTVSAPGFSDVAVPVRFVPSGYAWTVPATAVSAPLASTFSLATYALDPSGSVPIAAQPLRSGAAVRPVSIASSNPAAGTFVLSGSQVTFTPLLAGSTVLTLTQPEGFNTPSLRSALRVVVNNSLLSSRVPLFLGRDLQTSLTVAFGSSFGSPPKYPVTVASADPTRLLVSASPTAVGSSQISTTTNTIIYMQALTAEGTVALRFSGPSFEEAVYPVTLTPAGISIFQPTGGGPVALSAPLTLTTLSPDLTVAAGFFSESPIQLFSVSPVTLRAGVASLDIPVVSRHPNIARVSPGVVTFTPGANATANFAVSPRDSGDTAIALTVPPAFHSATAVEQIPVKVSLPAFYTAERPSVARDFIAAASLVPPYGIQIPSTLIATLASADPSRLLLSSRPDQPGQARITIPFSGNATYYLHGIAVGATAVTATASGFADSKIDVTVIPPTLSLGAAGNLIVGRSGQAVSVNFPQNVRPGAQISVNLLSSDPSVATIDSPFVLVGGAQNLGAKLTAIRPGTVTITADLPDGFSALGSSTSLTLNVVLPALPFSVPGSLTMGKDLQTFSSFYPSGSDSFDLTITSSDPARIVISNSQTAVGTASGTLKLAPGNMTTWVVQALTDSGLATVTFSAPGYQPIVVPVSLYPVTFTFTSSQYTTSRGGTFPVEIFPRLVLPSGVTSFTSQSLRAGLGAVSVNIANSQPGVGTLKTSVISATPGTSPWSTTFTAVAPGTTILTITQPSGYATPTADGQLVIVVN